MRRYVRANVSGGTFFFTVNLAERSSNRLLIEHVDALREAYRVTRRDHPFRTEAIVVLPEHLHAIWTLPQDDSDFSTRWALIKARFSRSIKAGERCSASRLRRRERGIWQRRYYEHVIRDDEGFARHFDYVHWNPVKHGWVERVADWPYSSFHRFVRRGWLPADWAAPLDTTTLDVE
ncbi:MAG: transposase [Rhodanobacteraceae bacterium]